MGRVFNEPPGRAQANGLVLCITHPPFKETEMNKSALSIFMAAMMAASGFAIAQTAPAMPGTQGGSGPSAAEKAAPGNMPNTRAEVKSQIGTGEAKAGTQGGSGPSPAQTAAPGNMPNSRADVKAEAMTGKGTAGIQGGSAASPADNMNTKNLNKSTTAEKKRMRDERRAAAKANREAKMKSGGTSSTAPSSEKAR